MTPPQKPGKSKQDYRTPPEFIKAVKKRFNIEEFSIDLAADCYNTQAKKYYTEQDSAFSHSPWVFDGIGWLNPPYTNIKEWVSRACWCQSKLLVLVPASVGSNWYRDYVHRQADVYFLNGRLAFIPDKLKWLYPKDLMILSYNMSNLEYGRVEVWDWKKSLAEDTQL